DVSDRPSGGRPRYRPSGGIRPPAVAGLGLGRPRGKAARPASTETPTMVSSTQPAMPPNMGASVPWAALPLSESSSSVAAGDSDGRDVGVEVFVGFPLAREML